MNKHTPGPWTYEQISNNAYVIDENGSAVMLYRNPDDEMKANARLIAAAPELLEALEGMLAIDQENHQRGHDDDDVCKEVQTARAAIAKAKGEQK